MAQAFRTQVISGYFDCRIFRQGVAKENRQMKPDGDTISFNVFTVLAFTVNLI